MRHPEVSKLAQVTLIQIEETASAAGPHESASIEKAPREVCLVWTLADWHRVSVEVTAAPIAISTQHISNLCFNFAFLSPFTLSLSHFDCCCFSANLILCHCRWSNHPSIMPTRSSVLLSPSARMIGRGGGGSNSISSRTKSCLLKSGSVKFYSMRTSLFDLHDLLLIDYYYNSFSSHFALDCFEIKLYGHSLSSNHLTFNKKIDTHNQPKHLLPPIKAIGHPTIVLSWRQ